MWPLQNSPYRLQVVRFRRLTHRSMRHDHDSTASLIRRSTAHLRVCSVLQFVSCLHSTTKVFEVILSIRRFIICSQAKPNETPESPTVRRIISVTKYFWTNFPFDLRAHDQCDVRKLNVHRLDGENYRQNKIFVECDRNTRGKNGTTEMYKKILFLSQKVKNF